METSSEVITINPVEYTEKMRRALQNFAQLSQQAITAQQELSVFNADINNLALQIYTQHGEKYAAERLNALQTTEYSIEHVGHFTTVHVRFISAIEAYTHEVTFEVNTETGEIIRIDTEYIEETLDNGVVDKAIQYVKKPIRSPIDVINHMNVDMFLIDRNYTELSLGRIAS
jgi:hypothetical protein